MTTVNLLTILLILISFLNLGFYKIFTGSKPSKVDKSVLPTSWYNPSEYEAIWMEVKDPLEIINVDSGYIFTKTRNKYKIFGLDSFNETQKASNYIREHIIKENKKVVIRPLVFSEYKNLPVLSEFPVLVFLNGKLINLEFISDDNTISKLKKYEKAFNDGKNWSDLDANIENLIGR